MKQKTSFSLTPECKALLAQLSDLLGIPQTGVIETLVRDKADEVGIGRPEVYIDDDGYVCFNDGDIVWALHLVDGWCAFYGDEKLYWTGDETFPTDLDQFEARQKFELFTMTKG